MKPFSQGLGVRLRGSVNTSKCSSDLTAVYSLGLGDWRCGAVSSWIKGEGRFVAVQC